MTRPLRLLLSLALLATLSPGLAGCGGGEPGIDEEIDAGGYAPADGGAATGPDAGGEESATEPAPIEAAEPTP